MNSLNQNQKFDQDHELKIYKTVEKLGSKWTDYCETFEELRDLLNVEMPDEERWFKEIVINIKVLGYNRDEELREILTEKSFLIGRALKLKSKEIDEVTAYLKYLKKQFCNKKPNETVLKIISQEKKEL